MKMKCKKIKIISMIASFVFMMFFNYANVNAAYYQENQNKVLSYALSKEENSATVTIQYQNGVSNIKVYVCEKNTDSNSCMNSPITTYYDDRKIVNTTSEDVKTYSKTFTTQYSGAPLNTYKDSVDTNGQETNNYKILIKAKFCVLRDQQKSDCLVWEESDRIIKEELTTLATGITADEGLNSSIVDILTVINNVVIPILWALLLILLLVRGILLGMEIVKASDDSELRKRKVSGLVWLFIGVFAAYAVTIIASIVMSMFGYGGLLK